jgi:hypothetical protein
MSTADASRGDPAADLAVVWDALDALPPAAASPLLAATTVELAAVATDAAAGRGAGPGRGMRGRWLGPAALVAAALAAGIVAGRGPAPDPDLRILTELPVVQYLDLLREAGSRKFLEEMSRRQYPPPGRVLNRQPAETRELDRQKYDAAIAALRAGLAAGTDVATLGERREAVRALPAEERVELERAVESFGRLSAAERRTLADVARALTDPARADLREAAWQWRQWLLLARPEDRSDVVARGSDKRLEWLDWYARRPEGRGGERPPRGGADMRPRRPRPDLPAEPPGDGPAGVEPPPRRPWLDDRPPFRPPARPRPAPPADAAGTPAVPR